MSTATKKFTQFVIGAATIGVLIVLTVACNGQTEEGNDEAPTGQCPSEVEQIYFDELNSKMRSIGTLTTIIGEDFARAGADSSLLFDEVWVMGITNNTYAIGRNADDILTLSSPGSAELVRKPAYDMAWRIKQEMSALEEGVEPLDLQRIEPTIALTFMST